MADDEHFAKLERMYVEAPCNERYRPGLDIAIGEGRTDLRIPVREEDFHAAGALHGSVYFKALDDAAFFAANSLVEDAFVLTTAFDVHLTRPVSDGTLRAEGEVVNDHPRQLLAEAVVRDDEGNQVARGTGTFVRSDLELSAEMGYE